MDIYLLNIGIKVYDEKKILKKKKFIENYLGVIHSHAPKANGVGTYPQRVKSSMT